MNAIPAIEEPELDPIDFTTLNIHELRQLKQQIDKGLSICQDSLQKLKFAQQKFVNSNGSVSDITPESEGKSILVPLTSSIYVPGKLHDSNNVLIEIGTGYFVEKSLDDAKDYFKRKIEFVTEQMEMIQVVLRKRSEVRDEVIEAIELKMQSDPTAVAAQS